MKKSVAKAARAPRRNSAQCRGRAYRNVKKQYKRWRQRVATT